MGKLLFLTHEDRVSGYMFWCPGCNRPHSFNTLARNVGGKDIPVWSFDGNTQSPTFHPSLRIFHRHPVTKAEITECHLFLTNGMIHYQGDCAHELVGKVVPLPEFPQR